MKTYKVWKQLFNILPIFTHSFLITYKDLLIPWIGRETEGNVKTPDNWIYFEALHAFASTQHNIKPPLLLSSVKGRNKSVPAQTFTGNQHPSKSNECTEYEFLDNEINEWTSPIQITSSVQTISPEHLIPITSPAQITQLTQITSPAQLSSPTQPRQSIQIPTTSKNLNEYDQQTSKNRRHKVTQSSELVQF